jgi:hypothetical protein
MLRNIKYFIEHFYYLKAFWSPFKPPNIKLYLGKIALGVPYFFPRKTIKSKTNPGKYEFKYLKWFGFNYCGLGYKTKWTSTDYRHEWNPVYSFIFLGLQFCISIVPKHDLHYWESWLYYNFKTDSSKSKTERIKQCIKEFRNTWTVFSNDGAERDVNYYNHILRNKYLKYIPK